MAKQHMLIRQLAACPNVLLANAAADLVHSSLMPTQTSDHICPHLINVYIWKWV